jgi:hypothetical protein
MHALLAAVPLLLTAMPLLLMDNTAPDSTALEFERWLQLEPVIAAAVECRQPLPVDLLDGIKAQAPGQWALTPARSFTVFGLPVQQVELFIAADGKEGATYSATLEKRSLEQAEQLLSLLAVSQPIGQLQAEQSNNQVKIRCTVPALAKME